MKIRPEQPEDAAVLRDLVAAAFDGKPYSNGTEARILERLHEAGDCLLSLVATRDGAPVGQVAFSPLEIGNSDGWVCLGPLSVLPAHQGQGIGSALVREGLAGMRARGVRGCILMGDPGYYGRFGFQSLPDLTLDGAASPYLQALPFGAARPAGAVRWHPAFGAD